MKSFLTKAVLATALLGFAGQAHATTVNVYNGPNAPGLDVDLDVQIVSGKAQFTFTNSSTGGAINSSIHEIYFENGLNSLLNTPYTFNAPGTSAGVSLTDQAPLAPANPTNGLSPAWSGNLFSVSYDSHQNNNAVQVGESWVILFNLDNVATTAAQILAAVLTESGTSRIALHMGECTTGSSCWGTIVHTPIPPAALLFGSGLVGLVVLGRRKKRAQQTV
jgi:hypothetical protein